MPPLSQLLEQAHPPIQAFMPKEPVEVHRAGERIRRRWPDAETADPETDPESLALEMDRRRRDGDWQEFFWVDAIHTACALLDNKLYERFSELFEFLLERIGPGEGWPAKSHYVRAMFRKYLSTFDPSSEATCRLAKKLEEHWSEAALPIERLVHDFHIFYPDTAPQTIAAYMNDQCNPFHALRNAGVEAPHGEGLMQKAHSCFVSQLQPRIESGDSSAMKKLLNWLKPTQNPLQGQGAGKAIDVLLMPWRECDPNQDIRNLLEDRLVAIYGDPRVNCTGAWSACQDHARYVMLRWRTGTTIRVFFDIVTQADRNPMWRNRKGFWIDLYEGDRIRQAWFALSNTAACIARNIGQGREGLSLEFARNESRNAQDRNKCLLIMNIDDRWVVEGSHSFPTWVFPRGNLDALKPYEKSYTCEQIRYIDGPERPERIVHARNWRNTVLTALQSN